MIMEQNKRNTASTSAEEQQAINKGEHHVGRAGQDDTHDISHMDQQEGTMNNGALGGNFESTVDEGSRTAGPSEERNK
jgi:hypothetical protein